MGDENATLTKLDLTGGFVTPTGRDRLPRLLALTALGLPAVRESNAQKSVASASEAALREAASATALGEAASATALGEAASERSSPTGEAALREAANAGTLPSTATSTSRASSEAKLLATLAVRPKDAGRRHVGTREPASRRAASPVGLLRSLDDWDPAATPALRHLYRDGMSPATVARIRATLPTLAVLESRAAFSDLRAPDTRVA
jgi:hypothetical protein